MNKPDKRDEHIKIKGNYLTAPRNSKSQRVHSFLKTILKLIGKRNGAGFEVSYIKKTTQNKPHFPYKPL
jgi:uncharacterized protein YprB with RNaseH-like and TPR domain